MKSLISMAAVAALALGGQAQAQSYDTVVGENAFYHNSSGDYDSAFGAYTMFYNTSGYYNTAIGFESLMQNSTSGYNTAVGFEAMLNSINGFNTAIGTEALYGNQTGRNNIAVGYFAGGIPQAGNYNIEIGNSGLANDSGVIRIGTQGQQKFTQIAGIYDSKVVGGRAVVVDSKGHLGYAKTTVVPNVAPAAASVNDVLSLRTEIASLRNEVRALKARVK